MTNPIIPDNDFLSLTMKNETQFSPCSFKLDNGTNVEIRDTGVIEFTPASTKKNRKEIVLSCGVHGNETAPIEMINNIIRQVLDESLVVTEHVLCLIANPGAINIGQRFVKENMNRLFSGAHANGGLSNRERERTGTLEMNVTRFFSQREKTSQHERYHYDLHTAIRCSKQEKFAVYPFLHDKPWSKDQLNFLAACGISAVLLYDKPTTTFSYFSAKNFNAHAFTLELGKVRPFGQNNMDNFRQTEEALISLITGKDIPFNEENIAMLSIYKSHQTIYRTQPDFSFTFSNEVENFTPYPADTLIGYDGKTPITTMIDDEVILFPLASVPIGQRALLTAAPYQFKKGELI